MWPQALSGLIRASFMLSIVGASGQITGWFSGAGDIGETQYSFPTGTGVIST